MVKRYICLLAGLLLSTMLFAEPTFIRHEAARVGDVFFYANNFLGLGTTSPKAYIDIQVNTSDKDSVPLLKISQNVGTPSYGIQFSGANFTADPATSRLSIVSAPSQNEIISFMRDRVIFGSHGDPNNLTAKAIVANTSGQKFSGNLLLRKDGQASSLPSVDISGGIPQFGRIKGRSDGPAVFRVIDGSDNHDIRFGIEEDGADTFLRVYIKPDGQSERSMYININADHHTKTFVIDHPVDKSKHLVHVGIEGAENGVFYQGSAQLEDGKVVITLPHYFESLTSREGRTIRLTHVDGFDPLMIESIDGEQVIKNGQFTISSPVKGSQQRFDWEVKAARKDISPLLVEPLKKSMKVEYMGPYSRSVVKGDKS